MQLLGHNGVLVWTSITGGRQHVEVPSDKVNLDWVLGNKLLLGSVNANREHFEMGIKDLALGRSDVSRRDRADSDDAHSRAGQLRPDDAAPWSTIRRRSRCSSKWPRVDQNELRSPVFSVCSLVSGRCCWLRRRLPAGEPSLRVMTFNIRYATAPDGDNAWDKRKDFLVDVIRKFDPDLLGTQEVLAAQVDFLAREAERLYAGGRGTRRRQAARRVLGRALQDRALRGRRLRHVLAQRNARPAWQQKLG